MILSADPKAGYLKYKSKIDQAVISVFEKGWYILGQEVSTFENDFAQFVGARYGVGMASGTDALLLALRACGIGKGDSVITVSHTAVATVAAIVLVGARPVLVDVDPETFTLNTAHLEETLLRNSDLKITGIVPVHLYGHPVDMEKVLELSSKYNLYVVEDCAQSHGATIGGKVTGSMGHLGAFSFYPTKNLGALGDGGAVVTRDPELHERLLMLRQYGWKERYVSDIAGYNSRLDEVQAAILRVKLKHLGDDNNRRREIADIYNQRLASTSLALPVEKEGCHHVYHQYTVRTPRRNSLREFLKSRGVAASILYPKPVHFQAGYQDLCIVGPRGLGNTELICEEILSLPVYPELSNDDVSYISDQIIAWGKNA